MSRATEFWAELLGPFHRDMAEQLDANDHKRGWDSLTVRKCLFRAEQELGELRKAVAADKSVDTIISEAADVGNFLAMLVYAARRDAEQESDAAVGEGRA